MSHSKNITVVVPVLNGERHIGEALDSLLSSQGCGVDIIVVDGKSTDNTLRVVQTFRKHLGQVISEPDEGQSDAIAKGFALAKTPYIAWLCSDDTVMPDTYKKGVAILESEPECAIAYGDILVCDDNGASLAVCRFPQAFTAPYLLQYNSVSQPGSLYRRAAVEKVGGLNAALHYVMDFDLYLRMLMMGFTSRHIHGFAAAFRLSSTTKSGGAAEKFVGEAADVLRRYGQEGCQGVNRAHRRAFRLRAIKMIRRLGIGRFAWWLSSQAIPRCFNDAQRGVALGLCVGRHFSGLRSGPYVCLDTPGEIVLGQNVIVRTGASLSGPCVVPMDTQVHSS